MQCVFYPMKMIFRIHVQIGTTPQSKNHHHRTGAVVTNIIVKWTILYSYRNHNIKLGMGHLTLVVLLSSYSFLTHSIPFIQRSRALSHTRCISLFFFYFILWVREHAVMVLHFEKPKYSTNVGHHFHSMMIGHRHSFAVAVPSWYYQHTMHNILCNICSFGWVSECVHPVCYMVE